MFIRGLPLSSGPVIGSTPISSGTSGSILFVDSSGFINQDNANLFWDDTNNRVGIGTTSPTVSLDVLVTAVGTAATGGSTVRNTTAAAAGAQQYSPTIILTGQGWKTDAPAASQTVDFAIQTRPVQAAANPTGQLHFLSQVNAGGYTSVMFINSVGQLNLGTSAAPQLTLTATARAGRFGIDGNGLFFAADTSGDSTLFYTNPGGGITERWRITNAGHLVSTGVVSIGVGTGSAPYAAQPSSSIGTSGGVMIGANSLSNLFASASNGAGTATMWIGNASINVTSDIRLKKNVTPTTMKAMEAFRQLRIVDFTWDDPSDTAPVNRNSRGRWTGLIAQEMIDVFPFIINAPDRNCLTCKAGRPCDKHSFWFVEYEALVPTLIKGFQEVDSEITKLRAKIVELENR